MRFNKTYYNYALPLALASTLSAVSAAPLLHRRAEGDKDSGQGFKYLGFITFFVVIVVVLWLGNAYRISKSDKMPKTKHLKILVPISSWRHRLEANSEKAKHKANHERAQDEADQIAAGERRKD